MTASAHVLPIGDGWSLWRVAALRGSGIPFERLAAFAEHGTGSGGPGPGADAGVPRMLTEPRFLEALAWQNPAATANWAARHAAALRGGEALPRRGSRDRLIARYAQRYCAKNDTVGFFGPVAWARLGAGDDGVVPSGGGGLRSATVHFEPWALRRLAESWALDERVAPHLPVRLHPAVSVEDGRLRRPGRPPRPLTGTAALVLAAAAGGTTLGELAAAVSAAGRLDRAAAHGEIEALRRDGVLCVGFLVPMDDRPEVRVRAQLDRVGDDSVRRRLTGELALLEGHRRSVADAAGDPGAVHRELTRLERAFAGLTGGPGTRSKERHATGRLLVYQDCRRDLDVAVGDRLLEELRAPLALLLRSARWLAAEVGEAVAAAARRRYRELRRRDRDVRLDQVYLGVADVLAGTPGTPVHAVVEDFQLRWGELLGGGDGAGPVRLSAAKIEAMAAALFPDAPVLWSAARQHSPDLLLARDGEGWQWVLGELHVALNTLESRVFHTHADDRGELLDATRADMAGGRVVALQPVDSPEVSPRTYPPLASHLPEGYRYLSYGEDAGAPGDAVTWPVTALRVWEEDGRLLTGPADGSWSAPVLEALGEFLTALVVDRFAVRPARAHNPRVLIDDVVVCRESRRLPAVDLPASVRDTAALAAALYAAGVPRHVFAKVRTEPKPVYVDLEAPLLVANLARLVRDVRDRPGRDGAGVVDLVEMLPGPGQLWLADGRGETYTCELRVVAVDGTAAEPVDPAAGPVRGDRSG